MIYDVTAGKDLDRVRILTGIKLMQKISICSKKKYFVTLNCPILHNRFIMITFPFLKDFL